MAANLNTIRLQDPIIHSKNDIFVYGDVNEPLTQIENTRFIGNVRNNFFKKGYRSMHPIQCYSWNEILDRRSLAMIAPRGAGKTIGFLPSLLSLLASDIESRVEKDDGFELNGPIAIIFVKSSREVEVIKHLCNELLTFPKLNIVTAAGMWNLEQKMVELLNGCDLLITTPPCFERLTEYDIIRVYNQEKIKYLAFDNFDLLYEQFDKHLARLFRTFVGYKPANENNLQLIITSTKWMEKMRSLFVQDYIQIMLISNFSEAAIMARTRFQVIVQEDAAKKSINLLNRLKSFDWRFQKTLILFNKASEVIEFKKLLNNQNDMFVFTALDKDDNPELTQRLCRLWQKESKGRMSMLLLADEVYQVHNISFERVQHLIHFSLTPSWTKFSRRFAASIDYYKQYINVKTLPSDVDRPITMILLDDENVKEFPRLLTLLGDKRLFKQLPHDINQKIHAIKNRVEGEKAEELKTVRLCSNFLKYADDSSSCKCEQRHNFILEDRATLLPFSGHVQFQLIGIFNPIHYAIKITHTKEGDDGWVSHSSKLEQIEAGLKKLQSYMNNNDNVKTAAIIKMEELYCHRDLVTHEWCRCKVISIDEIINSLTPYDVTLLFIDSGDRKTVKSTHIRELPEKFKQYDALAVDLRITNLAPHDFDKFFDRDTVREVTNKIQITQKKADFFFCTIKLAFANTIFATNFHMFRYIKELQTDKLEFSLRQFLVKHNLAVLNESIFEKIEMSALKAGFFTKEINESVEKPAEEMSGNAIQPLMQSIGEISINEVDLTHKIATHHRQKMLTNSENNGFSANEALDHSTIITMNEISEVIPDDSENDNPFSLKEQPLNIEWSQNNVMLTLKIKAHEILDYALEVDETYVDVTLRFKEAFGTSRFKLYSRIDADFVKNEIRNGAFLIYLMKNKVGEIWPRLSIENDKDHFIKPNESEKMKLLGQQLKEEEFKPAGFSQSEESIE